MRSGPSQAQATVRWTEVRGVRYPAEATCEPPASPSTLPCSATLAEARDAVRAALEAAVHHAAAQEAERRVAREITVTRQRIRALQDRWIPRLTAAIKEIDPRSTRPSAPTRRASCGWAGPMWAFRAMVPGPKSLVRGGPDR